MDPVGGDEGERKKKDGEKMESWTRYIHTLCRLVTTTLIIYGVRYPGRSTVLPLLTLFFFPPRIELGLSPDSLDEV